MTFARPEYLWLLAAVPICALFCGLAAFRRRRIAAGSRHARLPPARRPLKAVCFLSGLTLIALAAAGPGLGLETVAAGPARSLHLILALDCSRSMLARDLHPDRLAAAKELALSVLAKLPGVEAGLVGFAGRAWLACPVTADRAGLALVLDALSPGDAPLGGTSTPAALEASRLALAGIGEGAGAVVVLSDGEETVSARDAAGSWPREIPLFTVAVGGATPVAVPLPKGEGDVLRDASGAPVLVGVDAAGLADLAGRNGGRAFRLAPDSPNPAEGLAAALASLVPATDGARTITRPADRTGVFLLAGFFLLALDLGLAPVGRAVALALLLVLVQGRPGLAANQAGEGVGQGLTAYGAGRYGEALGAFLAARVWQPDSPEILYDIGAAYYRQGNFEAARDAFARAGQAVSPALRAKALYNQGNAAYRLGDADAAGRLYEAALAVDPADADARANLEWLRGRKSPPPAGQAGQDGERAPGASDPDPAGGEAGKTGEAGQAPSPQAGDDGQGGHEQGRQAEAGAPDPALADDPAAPAVPVAAREGQQGQKVGEKRAQAAGAISDPVLDRIPDLPGLPEPPRYGRPSVEKDW